MLDRPSSCAWLDSRLIPAPGVRVLQLAERTVLFSERAQQLFELNATAAQAWETVAQGGSPRTVPFALLDEWVRAGLLLPEPVRERARGRADCELHLRIGDLAATVALYGCGPEDLEPVFGQFGAAPEAGALRLSIVADSGGAFLLDDGAPHGFFAPERLVPEVKAVVTDRLSRSVRDGAFLLHAALLDHHGRGLLLAGAPGAGKTTLTMALAAAGFGYASDDIVQVSRDGALAGVPFAPASKSGAWELLGDLVADLPSHVRADGRQVRYVPTAVLPQGNPRDLGWVLMLDRLPGAAAVLEPIEPLTTLTELLAGAFSADHRLKAETLTGFAAQLAAANCRRLVYSDLGEAVALVKAWVGA